MAASLSGTKRGLEGVSRDGDGAVPDDEGALSSAYVGEDENLADDLRALSTSLLVSADGDRRFRVVALQFDATSPTLRAIDDGLDPTNHLDLWRSSTVLTVAADRGPFCWRTLTVVTVTRASVFFIERQSPLMPVVYLLLGESAMHSGVGRHLRTAIKTLTGAELTVPRHPAVADAASGAFVFREVVAVRTARTLREVGDFLMQHHLLGLTG